MKKFAIYAVYTVSKEVGIVEAETQDEALDLADDLDGVDGTLPLCHYCEGKIGDRPNFSSFEASEVE